MFNITIIEDTQNRPLTKSYGYVDGECKVLNREPNSVTYYWQEHEVSSLESLANGLASDVSPSQAILQGQVKKESRSLTKINRRLKESKTLEPLRSALADRSCPPSHRD